MSYQLFDIPSKNESESSESTGQYIGRQIGRTVARAGEAALGLPGDIASTIHGLGNIALGYFTGTENPLGTYEDLQDRFPSMYDPKIQEQLSNITGNQFNSDFINTPNAILKPFPTSEQVKKNITEPLTKEYLQPKTSGESGWDQIVGDTVALFNPTGGIIKGAIKAGLRSGLGNIAKWSTEAMTDSPLLGTVAKIGTNLITGIYGARGQLNDIKDKSYEYAIKNLPEDATVNVKDTKNLFKNLYENISKGDNPDKKDMLNRLDAFFNNVSETGDSSVKDLINLKQGWNRWLQNKELSKDMRALIKRGVGLVNDEIGKYGKKNPNFFSPYKIGEELTAGMNSQSIFQDVIKSHPKLEKLIKNPYLQSMLFYTGAKNLPIGTVAKYAIPALGLNEATKVLQLISKSPTALNHYAKMLQAAGRNNIPVLGREMKAFDKSASKALRKITNDYSDKETQKGKYVLYN